MITLFIDTSDTDVSIAILDNKKVLASLTKSIPNQHSIYTVSFIDELLKKTKLEPNAIERIMVVTGPGSFTGLRIGVTIAKVYAYLERRKVIAVSSLKMLALSCSHQYALSLLDAKHDNYYIGLYNEGNNEVIKEQFASKKQVLELIKEYKPVLLSQNDFSIDDYLVKKQILDFVKIVTYYQEKEGLNPHFVVPNYLKLPQALEVKK